MKRSPLRKVSKRQEERNKLYAEQRRSFLIEHSRCEICGKEATDVHHMKGRGINTNNVSTFCALCRNCHQWIHFTAEGKRFGKEHGYLK